MSKRVFVGVGVVFSGRVGSDQDTDERKYLIKHNLSLFALYRERIPIFRHEIWSLKKVTEVAYVPSLEIDLIFALCAAVSEVKAILTFN